MRFKVAFIAFVASFAVVAGTIPSSDTQVIEPSANVNSSWWPFLKHHTTSVPPTPTTTPSSTTQTPSPSPTTPTTPPTTSTTSPPTRTTPPTTSTTSPPTPTPPPTTSTTSPPTPTPPPTTSTTSPPTPTTPPTTSTTSPPTPTTPPTTSTTLPPMTSTPAPAPTPSDRGNWTVTEDNVTCIYLQAVLTAANLHYPQINNSLGYKTIEIPLNAKASGSCGNSSQVNATQRLELSWNNHSAVFIFRKINTTNQYDLHSVNISLTADNSTFPNVSTDITTLHYATATPLFVTSLQYSYQCSAQKKAQLLDGLNPNGTEVRGTLEFNKLHLQAFSQSRAANFGSPEDCEEDASDIVPIVVGCALAALVVIVLAVYVWGRRRSPNRGYVSM